MEQTQEWQRLSSRRSFLSGVATTTAGMLTGCSVGNEGASSTETETITGGPTSTNRPSTDTPNTSETETETAQPELSIPRRGDPEADVRILVFEDYACPHCREFSVNVVPQLISEYIEPGRILYEFHDFPIPVHEEISWEAACAARAVQDREGSAGFFEYAAALFENQSQLGPAKYEELASNQGLDGVEIRESAVNREYITTVRADRSAAQELGIRQTPTVVVGRQAVEPTYDAISSAIETQLSST